VKKRKLSTLLKLSPRQPQKNTVVLLDLNQIQLPEESLSLKRYQLRMTLGTLINSALSVFPKQKKLNLKRPMQMILPPLTVLTLPQTHPKSEKSIAKRQQKEGHLLTLVILVNLPPLSPKRQPLHPKTMITLEALMIGEMVMLKRQAQINQKLAQILMIFQTLEEVVHPPKPKNQTLQTLELEEIALKCKAHPQRGKFLRIESQWAIMMIKIPIKPVTLI